MDLLEHVLGLSPEAGGPRPGASLLVAVSGGLDSMVLLDVLDRVRSARALRLEVAHLDHGLRPDSADDARFVADQARARDLPFHTRRLDPDDLDLDLGPEGAAREVRYRWLREIRSARGLEAIATAHHRDDHVESLLLALGRGTGLTGMRGIAPVRGDLLRPFRDVPRRTLEEYARARELPHRVDPTNGDPGFRRNRVRHEVLPLLTGIFEGDVAGRIAGFARRLDRDRQALEEAAAMALETCVQERAPGRIRVDREAWRRLDPALQFHALRRMLRDTQTLEGPQRWNEAAYRRVLEFVDRGRSGSSTPLPGGGTIRLGREHWILADGPPETAEFVLSEEVLPALDDMVTFSQTRCARTAWFDAERVRSPILLRSAEPGDRIQPPGMQGHRKLTALFRERDIPVDQRSSMLVVEDTERIIWAVGITTAHDTRPSPRTERFLRLTVEPRTPDADRGQAPNAPSGT